MFAALGRFVVRNPWRVIAVWVVAAVAIVTLSPQLSDIVNADDTSFLPDSYESQQAQALAERAFPASTGATAVGVVLRSDGGPLTDADTQQVQQLSQELSGAGLDRVTGVQTGEQAISQNRMVQLLNVAFDGSTEDAAVTGSFEQLRERAGEALDGGDLTVGFTGDVAITADNEEVFSDAETIVGIATLVLIVVLQLVIFRSPIAAALPILSVGLVYYLSQSLIAAGGEIFDYQVGAFVPILLTVVLFGIGTDYILFLLFRFRERLRAGDDPRTAVVTAVTRVGEAIASAAAAVIVAFSAMLLASLGMFRSLGPALAISVAVMLLAALTLIPALLALIGPRVFWPSRSWQKTPEGSVYRRLGQVVARRTGVTALAAGALLVGLAASALAYNANYDLLSQLPSDTESRQTLGDLERGFPPGALNPTQIYLDGDEPLTEQQVQQIAGRLQEVDGVGQLMGVTPSPDGTVTQISLILADNPSSAAALETMEPLRDAAHAAAPSGFDVLVGGTTAQLADLQDATSRDLSVIFPVAGALIAVILAVLLRSLVAPLYLLGAVVLGYAASIGVSVIAFQGIGGDPGLIYMLPIMVYLFVVAIGTDYNILMVARLREEARDGRDPRTAAALALEHTGPSIGAAGIILAGTFASLMLAGVALLTQMGLAITLGVLLSAFLVSVLLVPSVTALVGHAAWWPGRGATPGSRGGGGDHAAPAPPGGATPAATPTTEDGVPVGQAPTRDR